MRRRHDKRPVLGADRVVWRHHARLRIAFELFAVHISEDSGRSAETGYLPLHRARAFVARDGASAAQDGRQFARVRERLGKTHRRQSSAALRQAFLGQRDHLDHALIGFPCALAESEDAVLQEHEAFDIAVLVEHVGDALGKRETRNRIRHIGDAPAEYFARNLLAVRLVGQREHCGRMGVVDEFVRQERVQQRFDGRIGRRRIEQIDALEIDHVLVGELVERAQTAQRREPHRRQPCGLDIPHVPAGTLDADDFDRVAQQVPHLRLDGGITAAVEHEPRIAAQQPRRIHAQRQIIADALGGIGCDDGFDLGVGPTGFHRRFLDLTFGKKGQKAIACRGARPSFGDEAGDESRRRHVETGIGRGASGRRNLHRCQTAIRQPPRHLENFVGGAFLDRNVAPFSESPVDGR